MEILREILEKIIQKTPQLRKRFKGNEAIILWTEIIDKEKVSWAEDFNDGDLYVATESPHYARTLKFERENIKKKLNNKIGEDIVKNIKIRISSK